MLINISEVAQKIYIHIDPSVELPPNKVQGDKWIALLMDGDCLNINPYVALAEVMQLSQVVVRRIYGNYNSRARHSQWEHLHQRYKVERRLLLGVHKNIADMAITADAIELLSLFRRSICLL